MDIVALPCETRTETKAKFLRREKLVPAECYGYEEKNRHLQIDYQTFRRAFHKAGTNTIIELDIDGKDKVQVLVQQIQTDPISDDYTHVDFMIVKQGQEITTEIPLTFTGIAPAVKELGGILIHAKDQVEIKCLPKDLIHEIEVDLSSLVDFHSSITIADVKVPSTITLTDAPETLVASVSAPKTEEEEEADRAAADEAAASLAEGEEGAEEGGEAPAEGGEAKEEGGEAKEEGGEG